MREYSVEFVCFAGTRVVFAVVLGGRSVGQIGHLGGLGAAVIIEHVGIGVKAATIGAFIGDGIGSI